MKTTKMKEWARREVDLAKTWLNNEDLEAMPEEYEAAYRCYCNFLDEFEKLKDTRIIKTVFTQLLHEENLSPIIDSEDDWTLVEGFDPAVGCDNPGWSIYQCKRRSSLFKKVAYDRKTGEVDEIMFRDIDRAVCIDINKPDYMYTGGIGSLLLDEMIPITLPYSPCGKIRIFTEDFKYHEEYEGDMDTVGVLYFRMPDGTMKEVKRFFKEDYKTKEMVEIGYQEYLSRKKRVEEKMKKTQKKDSSEIK
nr:MAG TPA: hypothetical protein [Caudoviricetes sp.]